MSNLLIVFLIFLFFEIVSPYFVYTQIKDVEGMTFKKVFIYISITYFCLFSIVYLCILFGFIVAIIFVALLIGALIFVFKRTKRHATVFKHHFKDYRFLYDERDGKLIRMLSHNKIKYSTYVDEEGRDIYPYIGELFDNNFIVYIHHEEKSNEILSEFDKLFKALDIKITYESKIIEKEFAPKATLNCINFIAKTLRDKGVEIISFAEINNMGYSLAIVLVDKLNEIEEFLIKD